MSMLILLMGDLVVIFLTLTHRRKTFIHILCTRDDLYCVRIQMENEQYLHYWSLDGEEVEIQDGILSLPQDSIVRHAHIRTSILAYY